MAYSHSKRIETWLWATDLMLLFAWCVLTYLIPESSRDILLRNGWGQIAYLVPERIQTTLAWVMGGAWFFGLMAVGGQNSAYLHPRYRIFVSMGLALAFSSIIGIFWMESGREWYLRGGIHFLIVLGVLGTVFRLILASVMQQPAMQLVPCRIPADFIPLLEELAGHPRIYVEPILEDPAGPLPDRRPRYPIYLGVSDLRLHESDFAALAPLYSRVEIADICDLYESTLGKAAMIRSDAGWTLPKALRMPSPIREAGKRTFDTFFILLMSPFFLPIICIAALAVKLTSRGPAFFLQERLGRHGKPFLLVKLRTMVTNAEEVGPQWTEANDPRVTPLGRMLRRLAIDEFPQLWNVLKGEMSLVGPRPEQPEIAERIEAHIPFYRARLLIPPGITGWAQLHQGGDVTLDDVAQKLRYDVYYLKYGSLLLDLRILLDTMQMLLHLAKPAPKAETVQRVPSSTT